MLWNKSLFFFTYRLTLSSNLVQISFKTHQTVYAQSPRVNVMWMYEFEPAGGALFRNLSGFSLPFSCLTSCQLDVLCVKWCSLPAAKCQNSLCAYLWRRNADACFPCNCSHWLEWWCFKVALLFRVLWDLSLKNLKHCIELSLGKENCGLFIYILFVRAFCRHFTFRLVYPWQAYLLNSHHIE